MKKLWRRVRKGSPGRGGDASPKSGSTRGSVASLNVSYEVKEKDLSKLHKAAWKGDLNKVKQLAKKDPSPLDKENRTPLHLACMQGHEHVVQELLEWKAKANIGDNHSRTPLMWAIDFQHEGCVNMLLSFDVDIDTADSQGNTPLHIAVVGSSLGIISSLIKNGASLNTRNKEGYAPLHLAVRNQHVDVCRLLFQAKADVNVTDTFSRTPLMYACQAGSLNLVKLLLDVNADTSLKDSKGWTADDCAVIQGQHACSQLITNHTLKTTYATPMTTPRSTSQPSSKLSTPRDKDSIGLPVLDAEEDDSDETVSKVSGAPGLDSWADSPDVSVVDDSGKKSKSSAPKVSLAKFAQNIHISESDTDGESVRVSTPRAQSTPADAGAGPGLAQVGAAIGKTSTKVARQISWQSQTSGEDNSWGDSPQTPRKTSSQKVSFKKAKEFNDIIESDDDSDIVVPTEKAQKVVTTASLAKLAEKITLSEADVGYVPSITTTSIAPPSADKIKGDASPALMAELGISDVDDISEMSEDADMSPPLPISQPPKLTQDGTIKEGRESDSTVVSGYVAIARPGILKKGTSKDDPKEDKPPAQPHLQVGQHSQVLSQLTSPTQPNLQVRQHSQVLSQLTGPAQPHLQVGQHSQPESGDESSAWDTTEAEVGHSARGMVQLPTATAPTIQHNDSVSEWDSELEDMANPVSHLTARISPPSLSMPVFAQEITGESANVHSSLVQNKGGKKNHEDDDEDWDSTLEMATPRGNAGLYYSEVNIVKLSELPAPAPLVVDKKAAAVAEDIPKPVADTAGARVVVPEEGGDSDSSWDSEADDVPSDAAALALYTSSVDQVFGVTALYQPSANGGQADNPQTAVVDSDDEDTETISSWEKERKMARLNEKKEREQQLVNKQELEERIMEMEEEELIRKKRELREESEIEAENVIKLEREDAVRLKEVERQWKEEAEHREEIKWQWEVEEEQIKRTEIKRAAGFSLHAGFLHTGDNVHANDFIDKVDNVHKDNFLDAGDNVHADNFLHRGDNVHADDFIDKVDNVHADDFLDAGDNVHADDFLHREDNVHADDFLHTVDDKVVYQQQELKRIDEQFQRERAERERREQEEKKLIKGQEEESRQADKSNAFTILKAPPPVPPPKPALPPRAQQPSISGLYGNTSSSAVQEIKQRLQVIPSYPPGPVSVAGSFYHETDGFDDDESLPLDLPGEERAGISKFYQLSSHSMYRPHDPLDDDALSYTSTEFEDPVQSTPAYGREREVLANINMSDPSSLLKVQEYVRDSRYSVEQERNQRVVLENKLRLFDKEKNEFVKNIESLMQQKSTLEQTKLDLEARIRSLEYNISEETEKRMNAEILLTKTKEQLTRKESQYSSELDAKQKADLAMRNLQIEMRTTANTIKELEEEKKELQRQLSHANSARILQEQINEDHQKLLLQQHHHQQLQKDDDYLESSFEFGADANKLKAELYALKMEMDRQRSRFKDEISLIGAENEELMSRVEELRNDIKLNEEALAHATMQFNIQISSLRADVSTANSVAERERATKEKLETEVESLKTRLVNANQEMDKAISTRNDIERQLQREKEFLNHEMDRKEGEVTALKDNVQGLNQRIAATEAKLNTMENELHISNTSLVERTSHLQQLQQELERHRVLFNSVDQNYRLEKEQSAKLQTKLESLQEKWSLQQHENLAMRQQVDSFKLNTGSPPGSDANEKLNSILTNLRADSDRAKTSLEERNNSLIEQLARLKEEVRGSETRRVVVEQDLRRFQDESKDMVKKLSQAEASLQMALKAKEQLEQEKVYLKMELDKLQQRYQTTHDKSVEAQARVSELVDRLEKAENSSLYSRQQLVDTSANMQGLVKSKMDQDDSFQQLQIGNARLEAELKYEKQRADMLYQDVQDSQRVRSNLEALCANLKSTSAHLEDRLGLEPEFDEGRLEIADLERNKQASDSKLVEEKNRANMTSEECKSMEARLEAEIAKNQKLQKDVATLKTHLKSAKSKVKDMGESSHQGNHYADVNNSLGSAAQPQQARYAEANGDIRAELEARYRRELNLKLENVNKFLDSQSQLRETLDNSRTEAEARLFTDKRRLEEEMHNLRVKFEQAVAQRDTKEMEAKRFRELYESEMTWRLKVSDQLQMATERGLNLKSKLSNERAHRTRLTGSIGNLSSSIVSNNSFDMGRVNGFHDDDLSNKIRAELDRSIAKHLEAAPHDHKPVIRPTKEPAQFSSSLRQSTQDYFDILNRKYCV